MVVRNIYIDTIDKVKELVSDATSASFEIDIISGRFKVNAKSILGIFSLNRTAPVEIVIDGNESDQDVQSFLAKISPYVVGR